MIDAVITAVIHWAVVSAVLVVLFYVVVIAIAIWEVQSARRRRRQEARDAEDEARQREAAFERFLQEETARGIEVMQRQRRSAA